MYAYILVTLLCTPGPPSPQKALLPLSFFVLLNSLLTVWQRQRACTIMHVEVTGQRGGVSLSFSKWALRRPDGRPWWTDPSHWSLPRRVYPGLPMWVELSPGAWGTPQWLQHWGPHSSSGSQPSWCYDPLIHVLMLCWHPTIHYFHCYFTTVFCYCYEP